MMRPGDIALFRPKDRRGHLISALTESPYCHIRLIVNAAGDTVEADFKGVMRGRVEKGDVIVSPPLTRVQRANVPAVAGDFVRRGVKYDWADVIALGLSRLGIREPAILRRLGRLDRLFCSQLVDITWRRVGFIAMKDRLPQDITPGDIADLAFISEWPTHVYQGDA